LFPHGCPHGYNTDPKKECHCSPHQIQNYISKISGPPLDRIDIHVEVPNVQYKDLTSDATGESSEEIREEVTKARETSATQILNQFPNVRKNNKKTLLVG
jgi:magnesium chelatase family protein